MAENGGAYRLHLRLSRAAWIQAGALGRFRLDPGEYIYVGSAKKALAQRVARHRRLGVEKRGPRRWHIDNLLLHRYCRWQEGELIPGGDECAISAALAATPGVGVPIPGFGATDCRRGCPAHLYRVKAL